MFLNYIKVAWRNMKNSPGYSFINITGLTVGMAVCLLILLFVQDELSYDNYHRHVDQVYRIQRGYLNADGSLASELCTMAPSFVGVLRNDLEGIEHIARLYGPGDTVVKVKDTSFIEERLFFAEPAVFEIFSIPLLQGDPETALNNTGSIVLSRSMVKKYFGDEDAVGKSLLLDNRFPFQVTAVMADVPANSHLHFDFLASYITLKGRFGSGDNDYFHGTRNFSDNVTLVYTRLAGGVSGQDIQARIPALLDRRFPPTEDRQGRLVKASEQIFLRFQKVKDIHLYSHTYNEFEANSDIKYVILFALIAIFILAIACINFINLATARAVRRAKEVGLRKVVGASKRTLAFQFLGESGIIAFISLVLALGLVALILPFFSRFTGRALAVAEILSPTGILILFGVLLFAGLTAGLYPAIYIASFRPAAILKGTLTRGRGGAVLRQALVVFQFSLSIALIFCVIVIYRQMSFMRNADLGFDRQNIILIPADREIINRWQGVKTALLRDNAIRAVTLSKRAPTGRLLDAPGFQVEVNGRQIRSTFNMPHNRVEHDFFKTYGIKVIAGRDFSTQYPTDVNEAFILNETAVRRLGFKSPMEAVGTPMQVFAPNKAGRVIGVVRDFNYESLHRQIVPIVTYIAVPQANTFSLRIAPGSLPKAIKHVKGVFDRFHPGVPLKYEFLNDRLARLYRNEARMMEMFGYFSLLAIFIGCLGLFGLAAFTAEMRTKEIGVRKVLGASVPNIFFLLSREFTRWVAAANLIAWPVAFFAMRLWLKNFAYRTTIGVVPFILSAALALLIACLTVSYQSVRAAVTNPVQALRYE